MARRWRKIAEIDGKCRSQQSTVFYSGVHAWTVAGQSPNQLRYHRVAGKRRSRVKTGHGDATRQPAPRSTTVKETTMDSTGQPVQADCERSLWSGRGAHGGGEGQGDRLGAGGDGSPRGADRTGVTPAGTFRRRLGGV